MIKPTIPINNIRKLSHSQNFLKNPAFVKSLLDKTDISASDLVIEIGPGKGIITDLLSRKAKRVIGIEKDHSLAVNLQKRFSHIKNIEIIEADFLKWNPPPESYKVFSNIPFNLTADIVNKLLNGESPPEVFYLILQDKAAQRFIGDPIATNTQTSILLKPFFEMAIIAQIDRKQFVPIPKIDAALVMFKKRPAPLIEPQFSQLFKDFVVYVYNQWKPTVFDALEKIFSHKQRLILEKKAQFYGAKPRDLALNQWLILFDAFLKHVDESKRDIVIGAEKRLKTRQKTLRKLHRTR